MRRPRVALERGVDAGRNTDHQRERGGNERQLQRRGQTLLEQIGHLARLPQRSTEIPARGVAEEVGELYVKRLVEAEIGTELGLLLRRRVLPHHERDGIAGEVEERESDECNNGQDNSRLEDPAQDESEHVN